MSRPSKKDANLTMMFRESDFAIPTKETLLKADMAEFNHKPVNDEAQKLVDHMMNLALKAEIIKEVRERTRSSKAKRSLESTIGAMTFDMVKADRNVAAMGYCFRPESGITLKRTRAAYRQYCAVRDQWKALGFLDHAKITKDAVELNGTSFAVPNLRASIYAPRLRATRKFLDVAKGYGITPENVDSHFKPAHRESYPVLLNKKAVGNRTPELDLIASKVYSLNAYLAKQAFTPSMTPELTAMFQDHPTAPGEAVRGGRLYSRSKDSFQQLSKAERLATTINGEAVREIDVRACNLSIFLGLGGGQLEVDRDPYAVPGVPREIVKHLVNAVFGKGHTGLTRWPQLKKDDPKNDALREVRRGRKVSNDLAAILEAIPELNKLPTKEGPRSLMLSGKLQQIEGAVMLETLMTLKDDRGITALPVHDSLIVAASKADVGAEVLRHHFKEATGSYPVLVVREAGRADRVWA